jgi:hypothetical protein
VENVRTNSVASIAVTFRHEFPHIVLALVEGKDAKKGRSERTVSPEHLHFEALPRRVLRQEDRHELLAAFELLDHLAYPDQVVGKVHRPFVVLDKDWTLHICDSGILPMASSPWWAAPAVGMVPYASLT